MPVPSLADCVAEAEMVVVLLRREVLDTEGQELAVWEASGEGDELKEGLGVAEESGEG